MVTPLDESSIESQNFFVIKFVNFQNSSSCAAFLQNLASCICCLLAVLAFILLQTLVIGKQRSLSESKLLSNLWAFSRKGGFTKCRASLRSIPLFKRSLNLASSLQILSFSLCLYCYCTVSLSINRLHA